MAKRLVTNENSVDFEYAEHEAYLNVDVELANGKRRSINYYEDRKTGEFKPVGIKLYRDVKLHAWLMDMLDAQELDEQDVELSLRVRYVKVGEKSSEEDEEFALAKRK